MKKFKVFGMVVVAIIACISMTACSSENDVPASNDEQEMYTVQLGWGGELDVTYEPLSRANTEDVYGIQVYSTPNKELAEGEKVTWTNYAYGLFDNADNISISLLKGYKYKFVATMVVDGQNKINKSSNKYSFPFYLLGDNQGSCEAENKFAYTSSTYMDYLDDGLTGLSNPNENVKHPNTERYYGELLDYVPEQSSNDKAKIHMKRVSFGAKFIAQGKLAVTGTLEILMADARKIQFDLSSQKQHSDIYTFSNVKDAHDYQTGNYTEDIKVDINWYYNTEDGSTVTVPLGTHIITYKRNATTVVKINIENTNVDGGIGFDITETGEMPDDGEYTVGDGENVDTEVDTNK